MNKRIFVLTIETITRDGRTAQVINAEDGQISLIEAARVLPVLIAQKAAEKSASKPMDAVASTLYKVWLQGE